MLLGAFGAHALESSLSLQSLVVYHTAVQYHFYHSLALLGVSITMTLHPTSKLLKVSGNAFILGVILFSGSLYLYAFSGIGWLGAVAPLGGLSFVVGWLALVLAARGDGGTGNDSR